ncbi:hypothetical protein SAMN02745130_02547 [Thiothrix eikelboomii]|uniref:Uncharacterized protein n=1 Tax=Thiothrix eikelboomii TaxID=92487 RepID=A0A1T4X5I1_9GAMM|nr:hypothetical protein [Thiothrix eikelboomii]SKA84883.1 hypothetical protein SAMN02745130_02547 [Thiothrix eikelboomii]
MTDSKTKTKFDRPAFIVRSKSLKDLLRDLRKAELWLFIAAIAAFLASAFFVVKYFVGGDMTPETWSSEQWMNALLGLGITAVITAAQAFLYASGYKGPAAIIATFIVVFFGLFSEISQSMEREDATVRHRSENSAVFQAAVGSINSLANSASSISNEQRALADTRAQLAYWQDLKVQKNARHEAVKYSHRSLDRKIADYERKLASYHHQVSLQDQTRSSLLGSAINQAKQLEYDEDKHYAMIRLIKDFLGVTGIWASFFFSVIIIGTFEYAFHFVGVYVADHRAALLLMGRDSQGKLINAPAEIPLVAQQAGRGVIPKDHANQLRDEYLAWVSPDRGERTNTTLPTENSQKLEELAVEENKVADMTQKRFFKIIYTDVRNRILNGEVKPTVRPVTEAVSTMIREKGERMGIKAALMGKPERQAIAEAILRTLEQETVVELNAEGGVGKPKYVLAPKYAEAMQLNKVAF